MNSTDPDPVSPDAGPNGPPPDAGDSKPWHTPRHEQADPEPGVLGAGGTGDVLGSAADAGAGALDLAGGAAAMAETAGSAIEGAGSALEAAGGCLEGCGSCSLAVLLLLCAAGTSLALIR